MVIGKGAAISFSRKQKLNAKSSIETELIGVKEALPQILLAHYFLEEQEYPTKKHIIHQDNQSSITLEQNGKSSSSNCTKNIKICYFFIKDKIDSNKVSVKYCPMEEMWADVLTKPLQGQKFHLM